MTVLYHKVIMSLKAFKSMVPYLILPLLFLAGNSYAQLPQGFVAKKLTANNIKECVTMAHAPDGRIFIAERSGIIKQLLNGAVTTVHTVTTTTAAEQGLLGIALHNNFASNGKLYLYYTNPGITRHYLDVIVLNAASQVTSNTRLMEFDPIINGYHNGGAMVFKDNLLYLCIGESNAPATAQNLDTYMGKVLRLQDDGQPAPGNPYYNTAGANRQKKSIWAIGMRNPWYMSMDPQTKKMYNVNVGAGFEEINDITSPDAARNYNYGWGTDNRSGTDQNPAITVLPVFGYKRELPGWNSQTCAITSGIAFNPMNTNYPTEYRNRFYFTDWCTSWLRSLDMNNISNGVWKEFAPTGFSRILGLSTGIDGNIYYSEYTGSGNIWRIEYTLSQMPQIVNHPLSKTVYAGESVTFTVSASGSNPLTYQWQKNGVNISGATSSSLTIPSVTTSDATTYRVVVKNSVGEVTSKEATLTVRPFNTLPVVDITSPSSSLTWSVNSTITYSGTATDAEDGSIPASAYNWEVRVYHKDCPTCEHWHPGPDAADGVTSGTFTAINGGETSSNIWLRLLLSVTDAGGRTSVDSIDIQPNKVTLTATSNPAGLQVVVGLGNTTPYTKTAVVNASIDLQAITPQVVGNTVYTFDSWAHGGTADQKIRVPAVNTTYNANFTGNAISTNNLALNKKAVASTPADPANAQRAVDGNSSSRWESVHKVENQWIYVDLGASYSVTRVKVLWENAMASNYRVEVSDDINNWGTPVKNVTGNTVALNDWTSANGLIPKTGRYVRIFGLTRTLDYGYSIYELEVYGAPKSGGGSNLSPSVSITSPANNASFTAPVNITLNANASDPDGTVSKVEFYNGATYLGVDNTAPYSFTWTGVATGNYSITSKATDNLNAATTSAPISITVMGTAAGNNLALNKKVVASTPADPANAMRAVDGNSTTTRWESTHKLDNQWIYVDLGARYNINRIKVLWEDARAASYRIEVSDDINNWGTPVMDVPNNTTTLNDWTITKGFIAKTSRYVRIFGLTRFRTAYGFSIYELEVYGSSAARLAAEDEIITEDVSLYPNPGFSDVTVKGRFSSASNVNLTIVDANGYVVFDKDYKNISENFEQRINITNLPDGAYVIRLVSGGKILSQKLIKQ